MNLSREWRRLLATDWRELELGEVGRWPLLLRWCVWVVVFGVALGGGVALRGSAVSRDIEAAERQEVGVLDAYQASVTELVRLRVLEGQVDELDQRLSRLLSMLPSGAEVPGLLDAVSTSARRRRLSVEALRLLEPRRHDFYVERPFELRVRGGYHAIGGFIADLGRLPRIITLHDLRLAPVPGAGVLELTAQARTYSMRAADEMADGTQEEEVAAP
ncbi:type 4a pilus biogenesis protein PilO [Halomonas sp. V046]|uniref:type 4a pilus biogenesis protein PilO n=1 Tax=Halomonas sp. V046 TaxID=3459611 RepID=UPI004043EA93